MQLLQITSIGLSFLCVVSIEAELNLLSADYKGT